MVRVPVVAAAREAVAVGDFAAGKHDKVKCDKSMVATMIK